MSSSALIAAENALARATRALGAAALRGGANYAARKIQRRFRKNKSRRRKGRKTRSDKGRKRGRRITKKDMSALTHGGIQKHYHYNNLQYCVTEENKIYNVGRHQVTTDPEHHFSDFYKLHDTMTIENNGYNTVTGAVGSTSFTGSDVTLYSNLDYTHGVGKWVTSGTPTAIESGYLSKQIWDLRAHYKKWKKDMITFTIRWETSIDNTHPLQIPEGFYRVIQPITVKDKLNASGQILLDTAFDRDVFRTDTRKLSDYQALQRMYGIPNSGTSGAVSAGEFPNEATAAALTPPPLETFTYENIARNPAGWKKLPRKRTFKISEVYNNPFSLTTKNNIFQDPIVLFVYKQVPNSWLRQTLHTTGSQSATALDVTTSPEHGTDIVPATIAVMKTAHCYSFKDRCEDIVLVPSNYFPLADQVPN